MAMSNPFAESYSQARGAFLEDAGVQGAAIAAIELDALGPHRETLTIDTALFGCQHPTRILIHLSGVHGVEGFAGSAVQRRLLTSLPRLGSSDAIVLVHAVNPYGMAWLRRANENNVDLNRNCLADFSKVQGLPEGYDLLDRILNPPGPPQCLDVFRWRMVYLARKHGLERITQLVAGGQYTNPRGLFYGGCRVEQGPQRLFAWLRPKLVSVRRATIIDVHTGYGRYGTVSRTFKIHPPGNAQSLPSAGPSARTALDYHPSGDMAEALVRSFPEIHWSRVYQEFGTLPSLSKLVALRDENRWHHYGNGHNILHPAKLRLTRAFNPDDREWREMALHEGQKLFQNIAETLTAE